MKIAVCAACLRASCWKGLFMCEQYRSAGMVNRSRTELRKLNREHSDFWNGGYERDELERKGAPL